MDALNTEDTMALSIFKCKVCCRRLKSPIYQVEVFGNICGSCHIISVYTNVKRNIEVETLLSKLYVNCNFAENGCTYSGPYGKTCDHEEKCRFRRRKCPMAYHQQCEFEFVDSNDIIDHIRSDHEENTSKVENNHIELSNPTEIDPVSFHLLQTDDAIILLRTMLKPAKDRIYYTSYHFGNKEVSLSLSLRGREAVLVTRHESEIRRNFDTKNAFKVTLEESYLKLKICFSIHNVNIRDNVNDLVWFEDKVWYKCSRCFKVTNETIKYCSLCHQMTCNVNCSCNCNGVNLYGNNSNIAVISLSKLTSTLRCTNTGCQQIIVGSAFNVHCSYQCPFKIYTCQVAECCWKGCLQEYVKHDVDKHSRLPVNEKTCSLKQSSTCYFINGDDVFQHIYRLINQKELHIEAVKVTQPHWTNSFTFIIKVKSKFEHRSITITGDYIIGGHTEKLCVEKYIDNGTLTLETDIRRN